MQKGFEVSVKKNEFLCFKFHFSLFCCTYWFLLNILMLVNISLELHSNLIREPDQIFAVTHRERRRSTWKSDEAHQTLQPEAANIINRIKPPRWWFMILAKQHPIKTPRPWGYCNFLSPLWVLSKEHSAQRMSSQGCLRNHGRSLKQFIL